MKIEVANKKLYNRKDVLESAKKSRLKFEIADMVFEARLKKGITQLELANRVGTKQPGISRIEAGEKLPSISFLEKIAEALDTTLVAPRFEFLQNVEYVYAELPAKEERTKTTLGSWNLNTFFWATSEAFDKTRDSNHAYGQLLSCNGGY